MHKIVTAGLILLCGACARPQGFPSLATRGAEAIDPRVPIASDPSPGIVDPATSAALARAVAAARGGTGAFDRLASRASALASAAGPRQSESWVAAQQALSALVAQHGVTTAAAADIDAIAANRIDEAHWLVPATRAAIEAAAAEVAAISDAQATVIARLSARLGT